MKKTQDIKELLLSRVKSMPKRWLILGAVASFLAVIIIWFFIGLAGVEGSAKHFSIASGERRSQIADRLEREGFIRSKYHFLILSYLKRAQINAGTFTLDPTQSVTTILANLTSSGRLEQRITIPEGWRREQIADYLKDKGVDAQEFLKLTEGKEGRLFPDTYYIAAEPDINDVVAKLTENFNTKVGAISETQLILASIVEREAKKDSERGLIAGIYQHRLDIGMRLDADPTVQYGRDTNLILAGSPPDTYWGAITLANYRNVISPYNTYSNDGLPPGPIANPGLKSIEAARNPEATSALYFFHTQDGNIITSNSLSEHNSNKAKYL